MMTNLFSMFDPSLSLFSFSWSMVILFLLVTPSLYWFSSFYYYCLFKIFGSLKKEIDYVLYKSVKGCYSLLGSVFFLVFLLNFFALFPFVFSITSHMLITLPLSFSLWLGVVSFCLFSSLKHFLSHLVPTGTPILLMSFMVVIELLSNFIRPIALTFRLTANMMAGHLLMSLIGGSLLKLSLSFLLLGSIFQSLLVVMEIGVSVVQSYVFFLLLLLYFSDSSH